MGFGNVFGRSWRDYKANFGPIFKLLLIFYALPILVLFILSSWWMVHNGLAGQIVSTYNSMNSFGNITALVSNQNNINVMGIQGLLKNSFSLPFFLVFLPILIIFIFINYFSCVALYSASLRKDKFSFEELILAGKKWYWKSLGFTIVLMIFLVLLFMALIIPGIIFSVFWIFSYLVFLDGGKGIISSLKGSFRIVKKRWWKTLGYILLFFLIMMGISIIFGIPSLIMQVIFLFVAYAGKMSIGMIVLSGFVKQIFNIALNFVTIPLSVLFIKNFYLLAKKNRK